MSEKLYFETLKEHQGEYFVEYQPPVIGMPFATLCLTFLGPIDAARVADLMGLELHRWLARYPVPLMVSAVDAKEDRIAVRDDPAEAHLVGWLDPTTKRAAQSWKLDDLTAFTRLNPSPPDWRNIYTDVPARTDAQVKADANKWAAERGRQNRALKIILVLWLSVIPASLAILEFFGPEWLGVAVLFFSLWKAWQTGLKLVGRRKPTADEVAESEKQQRMAHYYYHCERNPDAFMRLKVENFEEDSRQRVRQEAEQLATMQRVVANHSREE